MNYTKAVLDECEPGCTHEDRVEVDEQSEPLWWFLCPVFLATKGRGRALKVVPLVYADYGDGKGVIVPDNDVERLDTPVEKCVPCWCTWPVSHNNKWPEKGIHYTIECGSRSIYAPSWLEDNHIWRDEGTVREAWYGVCRRHLPDALGIKPKNRSYTKVSNVRDFQRSRVYRWEREVLPNICTPSMTLDDSRELVHTIWDAYAPDEVPSPQVSLGKSKRRSSGCRERIRLHPNHLNPIVTIHETAHALLGAAGSRDGHGPLFVRLYLELLERYAGETPEPAENLKVASYEELTAVEALRGFEIAAKAA